jgi:ATP-binding cassette subfamily B protein
MKKLDYFLTYAFRRKKYIAAALLLLLGDVAVTSVMPLLMSRVVDQGVLTGSIETVKSVTLVMALVAFGGCLVAFGFSAVLAVFSHRVSNDMRKDLFRRVHSLSFGQTDRFSSGALLTRIMSDTQIATQFGSAFFQMLLKPLLLFCSGFGLTLMISGHYAWVFAVFIPLQAVILFLFMKRLTPLFLKIQLRIEKINSLIQETLGNLRLIRSYIHEDAENLQFKGENDDLLGLNLKIQYTLAVMNPLIMLIINLVLIAILAVSGQLVRSGATEIGRVIAAIMYIQQIMMSLMMMGQIYQAAAKAAVSCERLEEISRMEPEVPDGTLELSGPFVSLECENVGYAFPETPPGAPPALEGISLSLSPGGMIGITGPTAAGKSVLVSLLARFRLPSSGAVRINGTDLREVSSASLRSLVTVVLQENDVSSGTIADNIRYGLDASNEEVRAAAAAAQADAFITALPEGYDTPVAQKGASLSGGQKQCIALARALLRRPQVLILDDCTSSLDLVTESRFHAALRQLLPDTALIVVSQRLPAILKADRILLLEEGRLSAAGTHRELLEKSEHYREICRAQEIGEVAS